MVVKIVSKENQMVQIGDWVRGTSEDGEFILGFVDNIHTSSKMVKVKVVQSDHDSAVGKTIEIASRSVKQMPSVRLEEDIRALIDLSLLTKDEEWFYELTKQSSSIPTKATNKHQSIVTKQTKNNRLGSSPFKG